MNRTRTHRRNNVITAAIIVLAAITASSIDAQAQPSPERSGQARALAGLCRADFKRLCAGVRPGGGRGLACLQQHLGELSPQCRDAIPKAENLRSKAAERATSLR
jgi:hypothetical protein